jgi:N-acetylglucosaminyldiphosphoundecaprenol N-acetyl-beta-D-mannosaminyltransferase
MLDALEILGVKVTNERISKILEYLFKRLNSSQEKTVIITPNPEMLVYASNHLDYKNNLNNSTISLPDGVGLFFASSFMGKTLKERIPGVDFIEELCRYSKNNPLSIGFLGGKEGVAELASERLLQKYPYLNIVFVGSEWNEGGFRFKERYQHRKPDTKIDILFVAYGVPKQEEWIFANIDSLPIKAAMGVGGSFDFISGIVPRAPLILRYAGLEWLFRLIVQPWRWKRQVALLKFISLVFKEKFQTSPKKSKK